MAGRKKNKHNSKLTTEDTEDTEKSVSFHKPFQQAVTKERAEAHILCVVCNESFCGGSFSLRFLLSFDNSCNRTQDGTAFRHSTPGNRVLYKATAHVDEWDTNPYYTANNVCRTSVPHLPPVLFHKPRQSVVRHVPDKKRRHGYSSHFPNTSMRFAEKAWLVGFHTARS